VTKKHLHITKII